MSPTWNEAKEARRLMRRRIPVHSIVKVLANKYTPEEITEAVIEMRAKEKEGRRKRRDNILRAADIEPRSDVAIPDAVVADRKHRQTLYPIDTTAWIMRDPLPGYSANDRAPSIAPSIHRDPLDALIFKRPGRSQKTGARYG